MGTRDDVQPQSLEAFMFPDSAGLRYVIAPCIKGWRWTVYAADGVAHVRGEATSRAIAAACVIRCIAGAVTPARAETFREAA